MRAVPPASAGSKQPNVDDAADPRARRTPLGKDISCQLGRGHGSPSVRPAGFACRTATGSPGAHACLDAALRRADTPDLTRLPQAEEPAPAFSDPLLDQLFRSLTEDAGGGREDRLLADSLVAAIAVRVAQRFGPSPGPRPDLSARRLHRVLEFIEANLDRNLTLAELAAVACLSPCHFSRSFREAVGVGPRRYTMRRRIERAKLLLRREGSLASIAAAAGFADQSHFTAAFRRETGTTPGRFRAASA